MTERDTGAEDATHRPVSPQDIGPYGRMFRWDADYLVYDEFDLPSYSELSAGHESSNGATGR